MSIKINQRLLWWIVFSCGVVPFIFLVINIVQQSIGPDPGEYMTRYTGQWALIMLLVCLAITPINKVFKWRWVLKYRRMVGLYSWFYSLLHFVVSVLLLLDIQDLIAELTMRPYAILGFISFIILSALAVTSPKAMVKKLGRKWKQLHRLVYAAGVLALAHFFWLTRADYTEPFIYASLFIFLMLFRLKIKKLISFPPKPVKS